MKTNGDSVRLANLTLPAKLLVTLFLLIVGPGYLFGTANILLQHQDADLEPGLGVDDLRRKFHGLTKQVAPKPDFTVTSTMLEQVIPGGEMREYLEKGGEPAIRSLIAWLEGGADKAEFSQAGLKQPGDPSPQAVIAAQCVECHNAEDGDMADVPFAPSRAAAPDFELVFELAQPESQRDETGPRTLTLAPTSVKNLVHITHAHILTMPVFTLLVGALFLMTGLGNPVKLILGPLPMLAVLTDIGSWWAARFIEPFIFVIAASGAVFGATYALQILCVLCSLWCGRKAGTTPA